MDKIDDLKLRTGTKMNLHFKRNADLEDEDIAGAWVGFIGGKPQPLIIFEWSATFQRHAKSRFHISYNENDVALKMFIRYISDYVHSYIEQHGNADDLIIELPEVKNEAA